METIIDFAKNTAKIEIISLEVRSDNKRAIALYKKFGFETVGTFCGFMKINTNMLIAILCICICKQSNKFRFIE